MGEMKALPDRAGDCGVDVGSGDCYGCAEGERRAVFLRRIRIVYDFSGDSRFNLPSVDGI